MGVKSRIAIFVIATVLFACFLGYLIFNSSSSSNSVEETAPTEVKNPVSISANGPDALEYDKQWQAQAQEEANAPESSANNEEGVETTLSEEDGTAAFSAAEQGMMQFYTVLDNESTEQYRARVGGYFEPGTQGYNVLMEQEQLGDLGEDSYVSVPVLDYLNPVSQNQDGSVTVLMSFSIKNEIVSGEENEPSQVLFSDELNTVKIAKNSAGEWKIVSIDE